MDLDANNIMAQASLGEVKVKVKEIGDEAATISIKIDGKEAYSGNSFL